MSRSSDDSSSPSWVGMPSGGGGWSVAAVAVSSVLLGAVAIYSWKRFRREQHSRDKDLQGLTVCLTGASEGIGRAVALNLGQRGARLLLGCRNVARGQQVAKQLHPSSLATVIPLDLADLSSIQDFCSRVEALAGDSGIQILINNAGAMIREADKDVILDSGVIMDRSMVVNHLGWFQLTQKLMPLLEKGAAQQQQQSSTTSPLLVKSRVVNVGSRLEKRAKLADPFVDRWLYDSPVPYSTFLAYSNSKLAMSATTFHWARQLEGKPVEMMLVTPGMVNTSLPRFMSLGTRILSYPIRAMCLKTPQQGAETVLFAATDKEVQNGKYYGECELITSSVVASAPSVGRRIYEASLRVVEERQRRQPQPQQ